MKVVIFPPVMCISQFSAAITEYHGLDNLWRIEVYLTPNSEGCKLQEQGAGILRAKLVHHNMVEGSHGDSE
jgi:hypothetical protein